MFVEPVGPKEWRKPLPLNWIEIVPILKRLAVDTDSVLVDALGPRPRGILRSRLLRMDELELST